MLNSSVLKQNSIEDTDTRAMQLLRGQEKLCRSNSAAVKAGLMTKTRLAAEAERGNAGWRILT